MGVLVQNEEYIGGVSQQFVDAVAQKQLISDKYSDESTYAVGDFCIYDDSLYVCNTAISTPEAWNSAHWDLTRVDDELKQVKSNLTDLPYYQDGDTFEVGLTYLIGMINSNNKSLGLTIVTPKIIPDGYTITISGSINNIRQLGSSGAVVSGITIDTPYRRGDNTIFQSITFTTSLTAYAGACIVPNSLVYTFHAPT